MMDIGIDMECTRCGSLFSHSFRQLPHARILKCPFCSCTSLELKGGLALEGRAQEGFHGRSTRFRFSHTKGERGK